jgi:ATP-binding protein involved in chromosome partitioning
VSTGGDEGRPVAMSDPSSPAGRVFHELATTLVETLLPPVEMAGCTARILELAAANLAAAEATPDPARE